MFANSFRLLAAGLCAAVALLPARAQDAKPNPATKPVSRMAQKGWKDRHEKFLAQTKKGDIDIVFLGDSITQGWERNGKEAWARTFAPLKAGNYGIGGDRTEHVLWRITEGKELDGLTPKLAVIMIGTNNMGSNTPEQIAEGVEAIVKQLRKDKPKMKILLLAIFPRASPKEVGKEATGATAKQLNTRVKKTNELLKKLGEAEDGRVGQTVFYKDIGEKFLDKDGGLPKDIMDDYLHLTPKGYQIWADAIKEDVKKLVK